MSKTTKLLAAAVIFGAASLGTTGAFAFDHGHGGGHDGRGHGGGHHGGYGWGHHGGGYGWGGGYYRHHHHGYYAPAIPFVRYGYGDSHHHHHD